MGLVVDILPGKEVSPEKWDAFIRQSRQGGIYLLHGYLSAVAADWEAYVVSDHETWLAVMPVKLSHKLGLTAFLTQPFSQYWGICFHPTVDQSTYSSLSQKRKSVIALLEKLPKIHLYIQQFSPQFDYPLPFHWENYELTTRYTYQLSLKGYEIDREKESFGKLWEGFASPLKRQINKAEKHGVSVERTSDYSPFQQLSKAQLSSGHDISGGNPASLSTLENISSYLLDSGNGFLLVAKDLEGNPLASAIFGLFEKQLIYLAGVYDGDQASSGAMSLLMWRGIQTGMQNGANMMDFEGSMIAGIETFFRKFGAYPVPYLQIRKNRLPLILRWLKT